ncbi:MAG: hypothetical protein JXR65_09985 [Bacteroidales bacterium]|nr:hypothetical protein [Bacteroidales bacterium]
MSKDELIEVIELIEEENFEEALVFLKHFDSPEAAWIQACLFRKLGDKWDSDYWYDKAGLTAPSYSFDTELSEIKALLNNL